MRNRKETEKKTQRYKKKINLRERAGYSEFELFKG
jgi:hypothetical protein